jgi:hypothetical protein
MHRWQKSIEMRHEGDLWIYESLEPFESFEFRVMLNDQQREAGGNHTISTGHSIALLGVTFEKR